MTTDKQIAANRRNSKKSTGPKTEQGKLRSRQNAFRHGLTAQTFISIVENADEYTDLETLIIADYEPQTTVERLLVERLASLLWRLRRAVTIETGLFQIRGRTVQDQQPPIQGMPNDPLSVFRNLLSQNKPGQSKRKPEKPNFDGAANDGQSRPQNPAPELSQRFLRLVRLDDRVLERIDRYEVGVWRQAAQTMLMLNTLRKVPRFYRRTNFGNIQPLGHNNPRPFFFKT